MTIRPRCSDVTPAPPTSPPTYLPNCHHLREQATQHSAWARHAERCPPSSFTMETPDHAPPCLSLRASHPSGGRYLRALGVGWGLKTCVRNANFNIQYNIGRYIRWIESECQGSISKDKIGVGAVVIFFSSCH